MSGRPISVPAPRPVRARRSRIARRRTRRQLMLGLTFVSPWIIGFLTLTVGPILLSLYYSFTNYNLILPPRSVGLYNYVSLFSDPAFFSALQNTLYVLAIMVPINLLAALCYGILMDQAGRGQTIYRTILYLPSLLPAVASAILWQWLFNPSYGLVNFFLSLIHIKGPLWFASTQWTLPALLIINLWGAGNSALLFFAALRGVRRDLHEQAMVDGAGLFWRFFKITLPQISPVIFFNLITGLIGGVQYFTQGFVIVGAQVQFFMTYIYTEAFTNLDMGFASAASWVMLVLTALMVGALFLSQRWWVYYDE